MHASKCDNCGSSDLQWHISTVGPRDVQDGRIRMSEVRPIAYLACEECSETIYVAQEDEINKMLNAKGGLIRAEDTKIRVGSSTRTGS